MPRVAITLLQPMPLLPIPPLSSFWPPLQPSSFSSIPSRPLFAWSLPTDRQWFYLFYLFLPWHISHSPSRHLFQPKLQYYQFHVHNFPEYATNWWFTGTTMVQIMNKVRSKEVSWKILKNLGFYRYYFLNVWGIALIIFFLWPFFVLHILVH